MLGIRTKKVLTAFTVPVTLLGGGGGYALFEPWREGPEADPLGLGAAVQHAARTRGPISTSEPFRLPGSGGLSFLRGEHWPMPEAAWALAGLGVASFAGALLLDGRAGEGLQGMRRCAPNCDQSVVDDVEREIQLSRIAGSLGLISLGAAAWLALAESPADIFASRASGAPRLRVFGSEAGARVVLTTNFEETLVALGRNPLGRSPPPLPPASAQGDSRVLGDEPR